MAWSPVEPQLVQVQRGVVALIWSFLELFYAFTVLVCAILWFAVSKVVRTSGVCSPCCFLSTDLTDSQGRLRNAAINSRHLLDNCRKEACSDSHPYHSPLASMNKVCVARSPETRGFSSSNKVLVANNKFDLKTLRTRLSKPDLIPERDGFFSSENVDPKGYWSMADAVRSQGSSCDLDGGSSCPETVSTDRRLKRKYAKVHPEGSRRFARNFSQEFSGVASSARSGAFNSKQLADDSLRQYAEESISIQSNEFLADDDTTEQNDDLEATPHTFQDLRDSYPECVVKELRMALETEREALSALYVELEEERNASASAASEAMAMITRLQDEKASILMEARQYQRMVDEKQQYDQEAILILKDILLRRDEEKYALEEEVMLYRRRILDARLDEIMGREVPSNRLELQDDNDFFEGKPCDYLLLEGNSEWKKGFKDHEAGDEVNDKFLDRVRDPIPVAIDIANDARSGNAVLERENFRNDSRDSCTALETGRKNLMGLFIAVQNESRSLATDPNEKAEQNERASDVFADIGESLRIEPPEEPQSEKGKFVRVARHNERENQCNVVGNEHVRVTSGNEDVHKKSEVVYGSFESMMESLRKEPGLGDEESIKTLNKLEENFQTQTRKGGARNGEELRRHWQKTLKSFGSDLRDKPQPRKPEPGLRSPEVANVEEVEIPAFSVGAVGELQSPVLHEDLQSRDVSEQDIPSGGLQSPGFRENRAQVPGLKDGDLAIGVDGQSMVDSETAETTKDREDRAIEEKRLSVLEYVWKFEEQLHHKGKKQPFQAGKGGAALDAKIPKRDKSSVHLEFVGDNRSGSTSGAGSTDLESGKKTTSYRGKAPGQSRPRRAEFDQKSNFLQSEGHQLREPGEGPSSGCISDTLKMKASEEEEGGCEAVAVHDIYEIRESPSGTSAGHDYKKAKDTTRADGSLAPSNLTRTRPSGVDGQGLLGNRISSEVLLPSITISNDVDRLGKPDTSPTFSVRKSESSMIMANSYVMDGSDMIRKVENILPSLEIIDPDGVMKPPVDIGSSCKLSDIGDIARSLAVCSVDNLTVRLKALETDRQMMEQTIASLKRQNGEMKLLQEISQQLREMRRMEQKSLNTVEEWQLSSLVSSFSGFLSISRLCGTVQAQVNKLARLFLKGTESGVFHQEPEHVGLCRLLQESPKSQPSTCLTREIRADSAVLHCSPDRVQPCSRSSLLSQQSWPTDIRERSETAFSGWEF